MTYLTLRLVHILFMATWIGAMLFLSGDVKRTLAGPAVHHPLLADRGRRAVKLGRLSGILTVLTGIGLMGVLGGKVEPAIHTGLLTGIAMLGVSIGMVGRAWRAIEGVIEGGGGAAEAASHMKKLARGTMIFHALWLLTLILMVFRTQLR